ncbi:MAG: hypothetical protein R3344_13660 [Acidobacteriota bacterium]|nr:hypothetical protein [Acidobacteriota bacterium]
MKPYRRLLFVVAVVVLLPTLAAAEEYVVFHDGRFLKVSDHQPAGKTMRLDLPGDSFILFPAARVDLIDRHGRIVYVGPRPGNDDPTTAVAAAETPSGERSTLVARNDR